MAGRGTLAPLPAVGSPQQIAVEYDVKRRFEALQKEFDAYKQKYNDTEISSLQNELNGITDRMDPVIDHFHFESVMFAAIDKLVSGKSEIKGKSY
jgi:hypothetical protein